MLGSCCDASVLYTSATLLLALPAGVTLPLLSQTIILFQLSLSYLVLKKSLDKEQVLSLQTANSAFFASARSAVIVFTGVHGSRSWL